MKTTIVFLVTLFTAQIGHSLTCDYFIRGDANGDDEVSADTSDAMYILNWYNYGGPAPWNMDAADANDSGVVDPSDAVYLLSFIFSSGPQPPAPYPYACLDPTLDSLESACDVRTDDGEYETEDEEATFSEVSGKDEWPENYTMADYVGYKRYVNATVETVYIDCEDEDYENKVTFTMPLDTESDPIRFTLAEMRGYVAESDSWTLSWAPELEIESEAEYPCDCYARITDPHDNRFDVKGGTQARWKITVKNLDDDDEETTVDVSDTIGKTIKDGSSTDPDCIYRHKYYLEWWQCVCSSGPNYFHEHISDWPWDGCESGCLSCADWSPDICAPTAENSWDKTMPTVVVTAQDLILMFNDFGADTDVFEIQSITHDMLRVQFHGANDDDPPDANLAEYEILQMRIIMEEPPTVSGPCN